MIFQRFAQNRLFKLLTFNILLQVFPLLAGLLSVPYTLNLLGQELFTIYALAIGFILSLGYLNFGITTGVNRDLAYTNIEDSKERSVIFWTGLISMILISILILLVLSTLMPFYIEQLNSQSEGVIEQASIFFKKLILQTPLIFVLLFFRSVLESQTKFEITATNRAAINSLLLTSPILIGFFDLPFIFLVDIFLILHLVSFFWLGYFCREFLLNLKPVYNHKAFKNLIISGSSLTLISISMLIFLYGDRFILSTKVDLLTASYFIAPLDLLMRFSLIYGSASAVFFPIFSSLNGKKNYSDLRSLFEISYWLVFVGVFSILFGITLFMPQLLGIWLGTDFAEKSIFVTLVLTFGILFTGLTAIPFKALVSLHQENTLGFFYILSSMMYIFLSYFLITNFGIVGAASAFLIRGVIELVLLNIFISLKLKQINDNNRNQFLDILFKSMAPLALLIALIFLDFTILYKFIVLFIFICFALLFFRKYFMLLKIFKI